MVLLCQADINFCGRYWLVNSWARYEEVIKERHAHECLCSARESAAGIISVLGHADHQGLLTTKR